MDREILKDKLGKKTVTVLPGEYAFSSDRLIQSIAGDCCLLCLHDPVSKCSGLCSFILPVSGDETDKDLMRQSVALIELIMAEFIKAGAVRTRLTAKIFGLGTIGVSSQIIKINTDFILHYLQKEKIQILSVNTGSGSYRELILIPDTGSAYIRHCTDAGICNKSKAAENAYMDKIRKSFTTKYVLFNNERSFS